MNRYAHTGRIPATPGLCHYCREPLLESRLAAAESIAGRWRLCCRDEGACKARRKAGRGKVVQNG